MIASVPVKAADTVEILTEDQFFSNNEQHPAMIEPAAGPVASVKVGNAKILTEDQFFGDASAEVAKASVSDVAVPSIQSEHDY